MTAPPTHGTIERAWRDFRETAIPKAASPSYLRASRLAFYASASATLADLAAVDFDPATIARLADELDAFVREHEPYPEIAP